MLVRKIRGLFFLIFILSNLLLAQEKADVVVAKDGTGNFLTIQEAVNSATPNSNRPFIILIKNGTYEEKVFLTKSNIALVGENRDSTKIIYAELRKNWLSEKEKTDWGSAVINIDSTANDIIIANLTVHNNYGSLYGDNDHQYAVRGWGTRTIIINCNVIADGADTIALWNPYGMSYHSNCYFEGWVDYVCPRGWSYVTDSKFYGHNLTASIWHHGSKNKDQKFVIRNSFFDGVPGFPLGRHHSYGQFYLIDCIFSENMADVPIFWPVSPNAKTWVWGDRQYYFNCHRIGGDYNWFKDNLSSAENSPTKEDITAEWTFAGKWNPEENMPAILPFVFLPRPRNGSYDNGKEIILKWVPSRNAVSHNVYFWKSDFPQALKKGVKLKDGPSAQGEPVFVKNQKENFYNPGILLDDATYYWRIDEILKDGSVLTGPVWHFTTK